MKDIALTKDYDLKVVGGDFIINESVLQEVDNILSSAQGNFKSNVLIGANIHQLINSKVLEREVQNRTKVQLALDNKDYEEVKSLIEINLKQL